MSARSLDEIVHDIREEAFLAKVLVHGERNRTKIVSAALVDREDRLDVLIEELESHRQRNPTPEEAQDHGSNGKRSTAQALCR